MDRQTERDSEEGAGGGRRGIDLDLKRVKQDFSGMLIAGFFPPG